MALTFNTGMTLIDAADSTSNWAAYRLAGAGGAPAAATADAFVEGTGALQAKLAGNGWDSGLIFDYFTANGSTTLDLTAAGSEVLAIWAQYLVPTFLQNRSAGGFYIIVQSSAETGTSAPTVYSKWYVDGADTYQGGWQLYLVDTRTTPSATGGGGANLAAVRRIGFGYICLATIGTVKGEPGYVDAMWYGRPNYRVTGDGSTVATWQDFIDHSESNGNGLIADRGGFWHLNCGVQFGDDAQTATTTFTDATGKKFVFHRHDYYQGGVVKPSLRYTDYYSITGEGAASFATAITLGQVVGTGDSRQGVLGGSFDAEVPGLRFGVDFETDIAHLSAVNLYGVRLTGAAQARFSGASASDVIGCTFNGCDEIQPNDAEFLNNFIVGPSPDRGLEVIPTHNVKQISFVAGETADQAAQRVWQADVSGPTFTEYTAEFSSAAAADVIPFPATEASGDYFAVGAPFKFKKLRVNTSTARSGGTLVWEYSQGGGSWGTLTPDSDGTTTLSVTGLQDMVFTPPTDWAVDSLAGEEPLFYVRLRVTATMTTNPIITQGFAADQVEHHVHLPEHETYGFADMQFFGFGASGAPKWHGENSETLQTITAGSFVVGFSYEIVTVGTTDFTLIGAASNTPGVRFVTTGAGTGTGTAYETAKVNNTGTSNTDEAEFENTGATAGVTWVAGSVSVSIEVLDVNNDPIQFVQVSVYRASDGLEIMNTDTNASGIASTSFSGTTPVAIYWRARKGSLGATKYRSKSGVGSIASGTGFSATVTMEENPYNNATT